jgi:allene oxide cyclase
MRNKLALATILAALVSGALVASVAAAASPGGSSTLRPWGRGLPTAETAAAQASPAGATRLVVIAREVDFTIIDVGPRGDTPGDTIVFTDDLFDQAGRRIGRDQAHCTIMFRGDVLCDASFVIAGRGQLLIHGVGLTFAVTGGTGEFKKARGQMHETFLPTGEFRFAFTLYL